MTVIGAGFFSFWGRGLNASIELALSRLLSYGQPLSSCGGDGQGTGRFGSRTWSMDSRLQKYPDIWDSITPQ